MTPTDLEAMMQNLNHRVARIEQILPTLATRDDLAPLATRSGVDALVQQLLAELVTKSDLDLLRKEFREELAAGFDDAKRYALVLHEDLKSDIRLIAEHVAEVMSRLPPRGR